MDELIIKALKAAGYTLAPTAESIKQCFLDYVDSGAWRNLDYDSAKEEIEDGLITVKEMCLALIQMN